MMTAAISPCDWSPAWAPIYISVNRVFTHLFEWPCNVSNPCFTMNKCINNEISSACSCSFPEKVMQKKTGGGGGDLWDSAFTAAHWLMGNCSLTYKSVGRDVCYDGIVTVVMAQSILYLCGKRQGNQCVWPITGGGLSLHVACGMLQVLDSRVNWRTWMQSVLTSVLAPARQRTEGFQQKTQNKKTLGDKTASSVLCLPPDVLFRDEFTSLHSAGDLYRPCLNKWGFSSAQCKDKDRRRRKLFAIWSINKNANSGKPFLRSDNGGVVSAAPRDGETDGPARRHHPEFFIFKLKHSDWREERGIHLSLHTLFFVKIICFWTGAGGVATLVEVWGSVGQSIGQRVKMVSEAQSGGLYWTGIVILFILSYFTLLTHWFLYFSWFSFIVQHIDFGFKLTKLRSGMELASQQKDLGSNPGLDGVWSQTCLECTPPLAQHQLGLTPVSLVTLKERVVQIMDGWVNSKLQLQSNVSVEAVLC